MDRSEAVAFLTATHGFLARQTDLSPNNAAVNRCLWRLVSTLQSWQANGFGADLPDDPSLAQIAFELPLLCGRAECAMEKWWTRRILASVCPGAQALETFWYLDHYRALCRAEYDLIGGAWQGRYAFLGSGALPVTAILLAQRHPGIRLRCVDCDPEACELSETLLRRLHLQDQVSVCMAEAQAVDLQGNETVICASLLRAPGLFDLMSQVGTQRLLIRDAEGVYRFCYRPAALPETGFVEKARTRLSEKQLNTTRYLHAVESALDFELSRHK